MTNYDRVSVIVGLVLVGTVLLLVLEIPTRTFQFTPLGTPLTFNLTGNWIVSLLLVGLSCAGTEAIMRTHPLVRRRVVRYTFPDWILPALTTLALSLYLPQSPNLLYWLLGLTLGGVLLAWLLLVNYHLLSPDDSEPALIRMGLGLVAYLLALIFFMTIYRTRLRSLVTATATSLVASLISVSLLRARGRSMRQVFLYAAVIGLIMGQTTWALNYWQANVRTVGVLLMLLFYILTGLVREYLRKTLDRRILVEFLSVAALGVWIILRFGPQ